MCTGSHQKATAFFFFQTVVCLLDRSTKLGLSQVVFTGVLAIHNSGPGQLFCRIGTLLLFLFPCVRYILLLCVNCDVCEFNTLNEKQNKRSVCCIFPFALSLVFLHFLDCCFVFHFQATVSNPFR